MQCITALEYYGWCDNRFLYKRVSQHLCAVCKRGGVSDGGLEVFEELIGFVSVDKADAGTIAAASWWLWKEL